MAVAKPNFYADLDYEFKTFSFEWSGKNYKNNRVYMGDFVKSPMFPPTIGPKFHLTLSPTHTQLNLILEESANAKSMLIDFQLNFLNDNRQPVTVVSATDKHFEIDNPLPPYLILYRQKGKEFPLSESGSLEINVEFTVKGLPVASQCQTAVAQVGNSTFVDDMLGLLKSGIHSDLVLESNDGHLFPVHKGILSSRVPQYFGQLLQPQRSEAHRSRLEVKFSAEVVSAVLEFVYSDEVGNLSTIAAQLLPAANFFHLDRLAEMCSVVIAETFTVDKDILNVAKM